MNTYEQRIDATSDKTGMLSVTKKRSLINLLFDDGEHLTINIRPGLTRKQVADMLNRLAFNVDSE